MTPTVGAGGMLRSSYDISIAHGRPKEMGILGHILILEGRASPNVVPQPGWSDLFIEVRDQTHPNTESQNLEMLTAPRAHD